MATQSRIGWRPYVTQVVNAIDADAQAFIAVAGITNLTQAAAISTLVNDLKTYGLWTKMKALYPMVGGSATSHKFNLKDPRDLDAAYRLVFNGGWAHTNTGALPNGTTGYADTKLNVLSVLTANNNHITYYSRTNDSTSNRRTEMGIESNFGINNINMRLLLTGYWGITNSFVFGAGNATSGGGVLSTNTDSRGFYQGNILSSSNRKAYKNGILVGSNTSLESQSLANGNMYIGCTNVYDVPRPFDYTNKEVSFSSIGDGLTDTEATNFYISVQKFQTTLGRQIGVPIVSDTDAQAFLNAAAITDLGQANAVNTLVIDLKAAGVWTKMKALYPFVGGNATSHKFNLKDPRDLDAAYRLVFSVAGWTHTAAGALSNGTSGYADPKIPANQIFTSTNGLMGVYTSSTSSNVGGYMYGVSNMGNSEWSMYYTSGGSLGFGMFGTNTLSSASTLQGLSAIGMETNGYRSIYKNDSRLISSNNGFVAMTQNFNMFLAARNAGGGVDGFASLLYSFSFISSTLTLTEYSAFYTAVQKYQTSLGRQIGTPVLPSGQTAGLLETYSGASAAYSLRKLRTGYVGNAIRVRRSSDNAEQDIAFDVNGGLDTTSLLSFVGSGNGFVTTWYDQSGNGVNISQPTAANQPQIVSVGVVRLLNNKPSIYFDGGNYYFNSSTQTVLSSGSGGYSIFGTAKPSGTSGPKCLFYIGSASGNNGVGFNLSNTQPRHYWFANDFDTSQTFSDTNTIYAVSYDGSKRYTAINNITQSQTVSGKNTTSPTLMVGRLQSYGQFFIGLQSELIIYNSYKDTSITNIYGSMNSYYSIY